jgi:hypothetical protein
VSVVGISWVGVMGGKFSRPSRVGIFGPGSVVASYILVKPRSIDLF